MTEKFPIKLNKKASDDYKKGYDDLYFHSEEEMIQRLEESLEGFNYPPKNPQMTGWSKAQVLSRLFPMMDLLCCWYNLALENNEPQLLLNGYYTHNYISSTFELSSGVDHSSRIRDILECYAGNNYALVDQYLPLEIGLSKQGHEFAITVVNLIYALRYNEKADEVIQASEIFLQKKNNKQGQALAMGLKALLNKDVVVFSEQLKILFDTQNTAKWLNDFYNLIGKSLPLPAYALLSMANKHLGTDFCKEVILPKSNLLWKEFVEFNMENNYKEGDYVVEFSGEHSFINKIHQQPKIFEWV